MNLKNGSIHQGDCLDVMKRIPCQSIGMVLCDLPYGTTANKWDVIIPLDALWAEYRRIIKPNGVVALASQGIFTAKLILSNEAWFKYKFVWIKNRSTGFLNARKQPLRQHEDICIFYNQQPNYTPVMGYGEPYYKGKVADRNTGSYGKIKIIEGKSDGGRYPTDTLFCKVATQEKGTKAWHPTQKPVELGRYLIRTFTTPADTVLDNCFGSGSFLVAAALEGRPYIGIEKNENVFVSDQPMDYMAVAKERLENAERIIEEMHNAPTLFKKLKPSFKKGTLGKRGMTDVNEALTILE